MMKPNYSKSKKQGLWTLFEASCLVADIKPPSIGHSPSWFSEIENKKVREIAEEAYRHAKDAVQLGELKTYPPSKNSIPSALARVKPTEYVAWIRQRGDPKISAELSNLFDDVQTANEKPLSTRERTTLLTIIAALLKQQNIDWNQTTKAATIVASATELLGCLVSQRAIEEHLKKIPDVIERKTKVRPQLRK
jgi:hypothetical protein